MPKLWDDEDWNRSAPTWVPTSDRGQTSPRLWVPNPHSLSPTGRSSIPFYKRRMIWIQQTTRKGQTRGAPIYLTNGPFSCLVCWEEGPTAPLHNTLSFDHHPVPWEYTISRGPDHAYRPFQKFSGFRDCGIKPVTPITENTELSGL